MSKKLERITLRSEDFAKWYTDVVRNGELFAYGPVKGTIIFKPYGFAIWENMRKILDEKFAQLGVQNALFPLLIPKSLFQKEKDHIEGFSPEIATVTKVGDKILSEELYIRPTSEVLFGQYFANELQGYRDLPMLYNQWVNILRWEKTTRPFLRTSEFLWQEGHTIHAESEEAKNFTRTILDIYEGFAKSNLCLPVIAGQKTTFEKFAGAKETYTIESLMQDGQVLQCGTSHYFEDNFSKVFNIKFTDKDNKVKFANSTSWGVSTRLIGAIIMTHSDDRGLLLPPDVAPYQVAILPLNNKEVTEKYTNDVKNLLSKNYRVYVDNSDKSLGFKSANAEIKGFPIRIEVGPKDIENKQVVIVRRDTSEKQFVKFDDIEKTINNLLKLYKENIYKIALEKRVDKSVVINSFVDYKKAIENKNILVYTMFCGDVDCEKTIKEETQTVSRCLPFTITDDIKKQLKNNCFKCNKKDAKVTIFGRAY
ncbi:proline--tRNA ligase [Spiroplasma endosymbiont of Anurida maritima]|uniref:proline--tRNA ligase n=1 Tax=Spiroplasma endosymbiont of Anurida maritima TaxID=2967972 RepID=UPI0036D258FE